jgi:hypothetical protein
MQWDKEAMRATPGAYQATATERSAGSTSVRQFQPSPQSISISSPFLDLSTGFNEDLGLFDETRPPGP